MTSRDGRVSDQIPLRIAALVLLLTVAAVCEVWRSVAITSGDFWWHLRSGLWIMQNHWFPHNGIFSQYAGRPWVDTSWLFDTLLGSVYKLIGLRAGPVVLMAGKLALAAVTFLLARGWNGNFWGAIVLSALGQFVIDLRPLPVVVSILFFGVELYLLLLSRRLSEVRPPFWMPLLFFFWANLDAQFLLGLVLLAIYVVTEVAESLLRPSYANSTARNKSLSKVCAMAALAALATLLTPYSVHLYSSAGYTSYSDVLFGNFREMEALAFRQPQHFVALLLVMGAFFALGKERSRDLFKFGVLVIFMMVGFRVQRDIWCAVLPAIAVIADALATWRPDVATAETSKRRGWEWRLVAPSALFVCFAAALFVPPNQALMGQAGRVFPVQACDFIQANHLPGALFNSYSWGGFLTWYLPEYPVAIDGRLDLYGDEINDRYFKLASGAGRFEDDPDFTRARTILLERNAAITKALTTLPGLSAQFRVVYQDDLATVLVRQ